jgi:hypothetical protein
MYISAKSSMGLVLRNGAATLFEAASMKYICKKGGGPPRDSCNLFYYELYTGTTQASKFYTYSGLIYIMKFVSCTIREEAPMP